MKYKHNNFLLLLSLGLSSVLSACSGAGVTAGSNNSKTALAVDFQIDYVGTIPVLNGSPTNSYFYVHNDGDTALTGISYNLAGASKLVTSSRIKPERNRTSAAGDITDANGFTLKASSLVTCSSIAAHSFCAIEFTTAALSIANQNNSLLQATVLDANGFSHSYAQVLNYSYYNSNLQSGVNFASSADIVANITNKKYLQAYLVAGGANSYSQVNLLISNNGALQINQGFVNGQTLAAGQLVPLEFAVNINSQQPYPIEATPQYLINSTSELRDSSLANLKSKNQNQSKSNQDPSLAAAVVSSGQSLYVNATSQSDSSLALKLGNIPLLSAPSTEANAATIYVSSFARVNDLTIEPDSSNVQVYANNCGSVIESNASCSFKLGVNATNSGSSSIVFKVRGRPIYSVITFYAPPVPVDGEANLVNNNSSVGIIGLLANQSSSILNLVFSNLGINALTNLIFTPLNPSGGSSHLEILSNSCDPKIESQAQCLIQVRMVSGTTLEQGSLYLDITGTAGTTSFSARSNAIDYYVNTSSNLIIASPIGSSATLSVVGNGMESQSTIFTLQNTGSSAAPINSITLTGINLPASLNISANHCGNSLAAGQSCNITVKYGPMLLEGNLSGVANLNVNYGATGASSNLTGTINYSGVGLDSYLSLTNVSASGFSGLGSAASPYAASGCSSEPMLIRLTYKNMSANFAAQNLALNIIDGYLTPYMSVDAAKTTCGYGASPKDLGVGQSCDLVLAADKDAMNNNSSYNLNLVYPSASWNTNQGFVRQNNFVYNGSSTTYATYTQPTLVSSITPASGSSLTRTLTQTLVNADSCGSLTTNITSLAAFGVTAAPTTTTSGCTVNNDGSVSCTNSSSSANNVINYTLDNNIPRPADLFFQFSLQNMGVKIWYNPSILLFNFSN